MVKEDNRRWPRVRQLNCKVDGCEGKAVSNDLCSKHNMSNYRKTDKGKAYVKEYNKRFKRPDIDKVCKSCGDGFITARKTQELCSKCSGYKKVREGGKTL